MCHSLSTQECHADSIIAEYKLPNPEACDGEDANGAVPSSVVLSRLAQLRLEPDSSEGSHQTRAHRRKARGGQDVEGHSWWEQTCTVREICDGQSLAFAGRWAVDERRYPEVSVKSEVAKRYMTYSEKVGTPELLNTLALGKYLELPCPSGRNRRIAN